MGFFNSADMVAVFQAGHYVATCQADEFGCCDRSHLHSRSTNQVGLAAEPRRDREW